MTAADTKALGERAEAMLEALASISAEPGKVTRLYLTEEHRRAARLVAEWMRRAGLRVRMDAAGTVHGLLAAGREGALAGKRLLVGSHIDTVVDAGRYDGTLGVVAGILAVEELRRRGIALPFALEVLAFGDEEGVRFPKTLLGSSVVSGALRDPMLDLTDADGVTIRAALAAFGGDPDALEAEAYRREDVLGYLEVHIEQGPVLEQLGLPLGVVTSIAVPGALPPDGEGRGGPRRHRADGRPPRCAGGGGGDGARDRGGGHDPEHRQDRRGRPDGDAGRDGRRDQGAAGGEQCDPRRGPLQPRPSRRRPTGRGKRRRPRSGGGSTQIAARRGVVVRIETVHEKPVAASRAGDGGEDRRRDRNRDRQAVAPAHVGRRP